MSRDPNQNEEIEDLDARIRELKKSGSERIWTLASEYEGRIKDARKAFDAALDQHIAAVIELVRKYDAQRLAAFLNEGKLFSLPPGKTEPEEVSHSATSVPSQNISGFPSNGRLTARQAVLEKLAESREVTVREIDDYVISRGLSKASSEKARVNLLQEGLAQKEKRVYSLTEKGQEIHGRPTMS